MKTSRVCPFMIVAVALSASCHDSPTTPAPREATYLWRVAGRAGDGPAAVDSTTVYFVASADSHVVHAFSRANGSPRWSTSTGLSGSAMPSFAGCTIAGALVICGNNVVSAMRRSDGALMWTFAPSGVTVGAFPASVNSSATLVFAPASGSVYGLDAATGTPAWTASVPPVGRTAVTRTVTDDDIVVAAFQVIAHRDSGGVIGLDAATGATRWIARFPVMNADSSSGGVDVALSGSTVFASVEDGRIVALDRASGAIKWTAPGVRDFPMRDFAGRAVGLDLRALCVVDSTVYASSTSGWLSAYNAATGARRWRAGDLYLVSISPLGADAGAVYVSSASGTIAALSTSAHAITWRTPSAPAFVSVAAPPGKYVYAGAGDGYYALVK